MGAGLSPFVSGAPLALGDGLAGAGEAVASRSTSMGVLGTLSAILAESLRRSSGGRLSGWVSRSWEAEERDEKVERLVGEVPEPGRR